MSSRILVDEIQNKTGTVSVAPTALVKEIDQWGVTTSPEPVGDGQNPVTGWERRTHYFTKTGTGLTYTSSNGGFALPSAGTWRIHYKFDFNCDSDDYAMTLDLDSSDDGGTTFSDSASAKRIYREQLGVVVAANDHRFTFAGTIVFSVSSSELSNFRFRWRYAGLPTNTVLQTQTNPDEGPNRTFFAIERIGD